MMEPVILASASPRRQDFFRLLGLPYCCVPAMIEETSPPGLSPCQAAEYIARRKTLSVAGRAGPAAAMTARWFFGADTVVVVDDQLFGKPADRAAAADMLTRLAGRRHEVITAMALHNSETGQTDSRSSISEVVFASLTAAEIDWYLDTGEWEGAAGGYRLQGIGACLIESIHGSPSSVAGLPLHDFYVMLRDNGYHFGA